MAKSEDLDQALRNAQRRPMTAHDREAQRRSFVYGNTKIEYDSLTREVVDEVAESLSGSSTKYG